MEGQEELEAEHGLSMWLECGGLHILFDTGQTGAFVENAKRMGVDLSVMDYLVLSHNHYDHGGGVRKLLETVRLKKDAKIFVGQEFFSRKYKIISDEEKKFIGNAFTEEQLTSFGYPIEKLHSKVTYLTEEIMLFHGFSQQNDFELLNPKFVLSEQGEWNVDPFLDETAIVIKTEKGLVVLAGCSHVGIINLLSNIRQERKEPIYMVIGGTHLVNAKEERIVKTANALKELGILKVAVSHCTGDEGAEYLRNAFGEDYMENHTGNVIEI